jgi:amino acid permease
METYQYDFKIRKNAAWALAVFVPLALYLLGVINFIAIISFAGAVSIGLEAILIALIFKKAKQINNRTPEYSLRVPNFVLTFLVILFALGVVYAFVY